MAYRHSPGTLLIPLFVYRRVPGCLGAHIHVCTCTYGGQRTTLCVISQVLSNFSFLRQSLTGLLAPSFQGPPVSAFSVLGFQACAPSHSFLHRFGGCDSDPSACPEGASPTTYFPRPHPIPLQHLCFDWLTEWSQVQHFTLGYPHHQLAFRKFQTVENSRFLE